jgi:serine/threonine protein kinase
MVLDRFTIDQNKKYGEGGYGATFAATDLLNGNEPCAVKVIDIRRQPLRVITVECNILEQLAGHPNVILIKGHAQGEPEKKQHHLYFIFMEKAGGGELFDRLIDAGGPIPEPRTHVYFSQMVGGIAHCHSRGVAHRDIKLENVLLDDNGVVKVIDFGLAHVYPVSSEGVVDRSQPLFDACGSRSYAAPEVMAAVRPHRGYDGFAADVWSLGVSLFAMNSGFFPLDEATTKDWRYPKLQIAQRQGLSSTAVIFKWYKRTPDALSPELVHLLDGMLMIDPTRRFTVAQVLAHPWLRGEKLPAAPALPGVAGGDYGSYSTQGEVDMEEPKWRGGGMQMAGADGEMMMEEDDDAPVYRSLGGSDDEPPKLIPGLMRQKAFGISKFEF